MSKMLMYLVAAVVVLGGGYYLMMMGSATPAPAASGTAQQAQQQTPPASTPGSFADIVKAGGSVQCTVSVTVQGTASKGTLYVSQGGANVRGDFSTTVNGKSMQSSMIKTGGYVYSWTDAFPQGFKVAASPTADPIASMNNGTVPPGTQYECRAWAPDPSKFAVPTDVKFMEMPKR
jgi:FlaG/FlaF family flagellin (archaellin)